MELLAKSDGEVESECESKPEEEYIAEFHKQKELQKPEFKCRTMKEVRSLRAAKAAEKSQSVELEA